jgi:hypothetical protein
MEEGDSRNKGAAGTLQTITRVGGIEKYLVVALLVVIALHSVGAQGLSRINSRGWFVSFQAQSIRAQGVSNKGVSIIRLVDD